MRFEGFVAARYLRGKRKNRFVSLITLISVAGVSVGVIALIVVMSVMTGFDIALRDTIIGNRAHLDVRQRFGKPIDDYDQMINEVKALGGDDVVAGAPKIEFQALLTKQGSSPEGAMIVGVEPSLEQHVTQIAENLTANGGRQFGEGNLPGDKEIVLGYRLAQRIGVFVGSELGVITANETTRPFSGRQMGRPVYLTVSGISQAKMSEVDTIFAFVNLNTARMLTGQKGVGAVHFKLEDPFLAEKVAIKIRDTLGYRTNTWYEAHEPFLQALAQEKLAMFIILAFIILVAAFNITSTLIMVVMEKRRDIGILLTLGTPRMSVMRIFMLEGLMIGMSGTFAGMVIGTALAYRLNTVAQWIASLLGLDLFNSTIYYFDGIPVAIVPWDIGWITLSAVLLTFLSTLYPAWSAARLNPVDALRYE